MEGSAELWESESTVLVDIAQLPEWHRTKLSEYKETVHCVFKKNKGFMFTIYETALEWEASTWWRSFLQQFLKEKPMQTLKRPHKVEKLTVWDDVKQVCEADGSSYPWWERWGQAGDSWTG